MTFVIGLDWGGTAHAVCVLDRSSGAVIDRFEARHDAGGLRDMERRLARQGAPGDLPVAVERMRRFRPIDFAVAARPSTGPTTRGELVR